MAVGVAVGAVAAVATFVQREEGCGENIGYARLASRHQRRASFVWSGAQERAEPWQAIGTLLSYCEQNLFRKVHQKPGLPGFFNRRCRVTPKVTRLWTLLEVALYVLGNTLTAGRD